MTMGPRDAALEALCALEGPLARLEGGARDLLDWAALPDERDRALAVQLVQGVMRWRATLDWIIARKLRFPFSELEPRVLDILRLAVFQITRMDRIPQSAAVNEAVKQARACARPHVAAFVNGLLRAVCREGEPPPFPDRKRDLRRHLAVVHAYPEWLVDRWLKEWGMPAAEELMAAGNRLPDLTIRVNRMRIGRSALIRALAEEGVAAERTAYAPEGLVIRGVKGGVERLKAFREGCFQVQGEGAQVFSHLLGPQPGERVLDLCAGLGGKSTHLAELIEGRGLVVAVDLQPRRLRGLREAARRLGLGGCIHCAAADALHGAANAFRGGFDRILVDAPCSGLGVLSGHPDIKWRRRPEDIARLAGLQLGILEGAARMLKENGALFYGTCTLTREENEGVVEAFLAAHPDMAQEDLRVQAPPWARPLIDARGFLQILPHVHGLDGFFGALLRRKGGREGAGAPDHPLRDEHGSESIRK